MKYFTKEWYELCQRTRYHLPLHISDKAQSFSEEYFKTIYRRKLRAFLKEDKRYSELWRSHLKLTAEDQVALIAKFKSRHVSNVDLLLKDLPAEILKDVADIRVLALDIATKDIKRRIQEWCQANSMQIKQTKNNYQVHLTKNRERIGPAIVERFAFHDCTVLATESHGQDFLILLEPSWKFPDASAIEFHDCRIIEQESSLVGAWWLYEEIYPVEHGNEYHVLLQMEDEQLVYLTVHSTSITIGR